jgi:MYXO-CTERM domain-containing protein
LGPRLEDAGFGAASTLALVLLMGAGALLIRQQRRRIAVY